MANGHHGNTAPGLEPDTHPNQVDNRDGQNRDTEETDECIFKGSEEWNLEHIETDIATVCGIGNAKLTAVEKEHDFFPPFGEILAEHKCNHSDTECRKPLDSGVTDVAKLIIDTDVKLLCISKCETHI